MTAKNTARLFLKYGFARHGLPQSVVSDRGTQFTSDFWRYLCKALRIQQRLSSAYHPQTDGQSERSNQTMEAYLRAYVNYAQDDWVDWLPLAEFAANNHVSESTGVTPFYANYGRHPRFTSDCLEVDELLLQHKGPKRVEQQMARDFALRMTNLHAKLRQELLLSAQIQTDAANASRAVHRQYHAGDQVYVSTKNFKTARPSKKLDLKFAGPYTVLRALGDEDPLTYELDLPADLHVFNKFHVSLLQPATPDTDHQPLPGQILPPPPAIEITRNDGTEQEWEVDEVVDSKMKLKPGRLAAGVTVRPSTELFRVRWKGYDELTWEPKENLEGSQEHIARYRLRQEQSIQQNSVLLDEMPVSDQAIDDKAQWTIVSTASAAQSGRRTPTNPHQYRSDDAPPVPVAGIATDVEDDTAFAHQLSRLRGLRPV